VHPFETVNGVEARALRRPRPAVGGDDLLNAGYHTAGGEPGNVLLAFSVDGK
jgi:hypothetical protein